MGSSLNNPRIALREESINGQPSVGEDILGFSSDGRRFGFRWNNIEEGVFVPEEWKSIRKHQHFQTGISYVCYMANF